MAGVRRSKVMVCALATVLLTGCAASEPPGAATATWQLASPGAVSPGSQELDVAVTRLGCAGGKTGSVLEPRVKYELDRILIRTNVVAVDGAQECPGNDAVPVTINLEEPVGDRQLVDAACLDTEATDTIFCTDNGVRWPATPR